jgi:4-oxalocrotonate tautomerase
VPLVRISVDSSVSSETRETIASEVYESMRETIGIPDGDRFILVSSHNADEWFIDPTFPGLQRSAKFVLIHTTLSRGRTVEQKQALYARIAERLHESAMILPDDVMIVLSENNFEDWSFGKGQAQYVLNPPAWARKATQ